MKNKSIGILAIILGIIIIAFPMIGVIGTSALFGLSTLLVSIIVLMIGFYYGLQYSWSSY